MSNYPRYAIYYAPAPSSEFDRFGADLLGYDALTGAELPFPEDATATAPDWRELTSDARKYGFHATLKAPFSLGKGKTEAELFVACAAFAATPRAIPLFKPMVGSISGFIAVIPAEMPPQLVRLAADCVSEFDVLRAPLTEANRARRNPSQLTAIQCEYLDRWGYPYVMEEFRFHMTLTGRLGSERREPILAMLRSRFASTGIETLAINRIVVFRQENAASRFRIVGQWELCAAQPAACDQEQPST